MNSASRTTVPLTFIVIAPVLLIFVVSCGLPPVLVDDLPRMEAPARPEWDEPTEPLVERPEEPSVVEMHLDISYPMAGFLPPPSRGDLSTFHIVTQNVAQHMARVYGRAGGVAVQWRGIGHDIRDLPPAPRIQPNLFDGRSTRLDLSIESVLAAFRSGQAEAAAIVTDLMATGEGTGVTGPLTVANALGDWLRSEDVLAGVFHVGLLGVKAEYRGVTHPTECPPGPPLGCWYDERLPGFRRLDSVARIPFYVLVLGRGETNVTSVLESLKRGIDELDRNVETQSELLTRRSLSFDTALSCTARQPQFALFVDERQQHRCERDDSVTLSCGFENGFQPNAGRGIWEPTANSGDGQTPEPPNVRVDGTQLAVDLNCAALRGARPPDADLRLRLDVTGTVDDPTTDWSDWSTELAALGKTTHLDGFARAVRIEPDRYRVELPAILHFPGS